MLEEALAGYGRYLDLLQARAEPDLIIQAFNEYQLCAPCGRGRLGVAGLNGQMSSLPTEAQNSSSSTLVGTKVDR